MKILFLIHDLSVGGAEKVLVNLVNNMDCKKFDITVMSLFDIGVNKQFLKRHIHYKYVFKRSMPGNSHVMKLLTSQMLHRLFIKEEYDIEVSYLEGPCARIISGCSNPNTKLVSWIHIEQHTSKKASASFRSIQEAEKCYNRFNKIVCVSEMVKNDFADILRIRVPIEVCYNTNESNQIIKEAQEGVEDNLFKNKKINLVGVGKLIPKKGFDRMVRIVKRLKEENYPVHLYILGIGPEQKKLEEYIEKNSLIHDVSFLGYQTNPYKYVSKSDLFICASYAEGFSTAATEALIVGTPVCTVKVSGMKEMLGECNEYGVVVDNDEESLYLGIKRLLDNPALLYHYKEKAIERGKDFKVENTVKKVERMLLKLMDENTK